MKKFVIVFIIALLGVSAANSQVADSTAASEAAPVLSPAELAQAQADSIKAAKKQARLAALKKWTFKESFGGTLNTGNVNSVSIANSGSIERNDSLISMSADYGITYGEKDHEVYDKGFNTSAKLDLWQYGRWSPFLSASYLNNKFKGYEYKVSLLLGCKFRIYTKPSICDYSVSAAFVYDFVDYVGVVDESLLKPQVARLSLRFKFRQKIGPAVSLKHTTFYQPSFMNFGGDWIFTTNTALETTINKYLSFDISFNYEYRSIVPEGIHHHDLITAASLKFKF